MTARFLFTENRKKPTFVGKSFVKVKIVAEAHAPKAQSTLNGVKRRLTTA